MKRGLLILTLVWGMLACDDVFEKDLTGKQVQVVAPSDGLVTTAGRIVFLWEETEGASSYHLRLVEGKFGGGCRAVADTIMQNDSTGVKRSYTLELEAGEYQWGIRATNGAYQTPETVSSLTVVTPPQTEDAQ